MKISNKKIGKRILVLRLSSFGDVLLSSAFVRALKSTFPDSTIDYAVSKEYIDIFRFNPNIERIFEYDKSLGHTENKRNLWEFMTISRINKYDIAIDLQNNFRSYYLLNSEAEILKKIRKNRLNKLSLVYRKRAIKKIDSVVGVYADTMRDFGLKLDDDGLELWLPEEVGLNKYPPQLREKRKENKLVISIAPGAKHFTKRWILSSYIELTKMLLSRFECEIHLLGSKEDTEICSEIRSTIGEKIRNFAGATSIYEAARKLDNSDILISNDSGLMHLAASRRVPVVAIFGSTVTEFGFSPYKSTSRIIQADVECRPCSHIGKSSCPKGHFRCMNDIKPNEVFEAVNQIIRKESEKSINNIIQG